jgi:hypothetical protein
MGDLQQCWDARTTTRAVERSPRFCYLSHMPCMMSYVNHTSLPIISYYRKLNPLDAKTRNRACPSVHSPSEQPMESPSSNVSTFPPRGGRGIQEGDHVRQPTSDHAVWRAHAQPPARTRAVGLQVAEGTFGNFHQLCTALQQHLAGIRQTERSSRPVKQASALLQFGHIAANGRLGKAKRRYSAGEVSTKCHFAEFFDEIETAHKWGSIFAPPSSVSPRCQLNTGARPSQQRYFTSRNSSMP